MNEEIVWSAKTAIPADGQADRPTGESVDRQAGGCTGDGVVAAAVGGGAKKLWASGWASKRADGGQAGRHTDRS